jgi:hypothetical protein
MSVILVALALGACEEIGRHSWSGEFALLQRATIGAASSFDKLRTRLILLGDATKALSSC